MVHWTDTQFYLWESLNRSIEDFVSLYPFFFPFSKNMYFCSGPKTTNYLWLWHFRNFESITLLSFFYFKVSGASLIPMWLNSIWVEQMRWIGQSSTSLKTHLLVTANVFVDGWKHKNLMKNEKWYSHTVKRKDGIRPLTFCSMPHMPWSANGTACRRLSTEPEEKVFTTKQHAAEVLYVYSFLQLLPIVHILCKNLRQYKFK